MTKSLSESPPRSCAPVIAARTAIFSPSQRPAPRPGGDWIETPHGRVRVTGRLGQRHQDLLEALLFHNSVRVGSHDGRIHLLVDPHRVRMRA